MDLRSLTTPWLAPLMRQRSMCRAISAVMAVLAVATLSGLRLWPCLFAEMTGLPCPGCGMTRATLALLHGDFRTALRLHPFVPFFFVLGGFVAAGAFAPRLKLDTWAARVERFERKSRITVIFLAALVGFSLLRMAGLWYQPPISDPAGALFNRKPAGLVKQADIQSHPKPKSYALRYS